MEAAPPPAASRGLLAALLLGAGATHLAFARLYDGLIPAALGPPRPWVYGSGLAELVIGGLLVPPRTARAGAWAAAALLVAVMPGNVVYAMRAGPPDPRRPLARASLAWMRVPLQAPLVAWALRLARGAPPPPRDRASEWGVRPPRPRRWTARRGPRRGDAAAAGVARATGA